MSCPRCACRDYRTVSQREAVLRGVRVIVARVACRSCGAVFSVQKKPRSEDRDEAAVPPDHHETRRNADGDNPYV